MVLTNNEFAGTATLDSPVPTIRIYSPDHDSANSTDSSEIIYTPPESVINMAPPDSETPVTPSASSPEGPVMIAAFHGPAPPPPVTEANISIREYIYFLPYPLPPGTPVPYSHNLPHKNPVNLPSHQFEPTCTLVLTSPAATFVDVRLFKPLYPGDVGLLPNRGESHRLEWAFAGRSTSAPIEIPDWENVSHSTWTHWLDSRYPVGMGKAQPPVDEGDMYPINPELTLEHGHAFHPSFNAVKSHEEMWRDVPLTSTNDRGTRIAIVMRVQADTHGVRGVVVRVGQYVQGVLMQGEKCTVERWEFDDSGEGVEAMRWKRIARTGDGFLPCAVAFRPEIVAVGGVVKYGDFEWRVEEAWEWKEEDEEDEEA